jgi:hypothetical protein
MRKRNRPALVARGIAGQSLVPLVFALFMMAMKG